VSRREAWWAILLASPDRAVEPGKLMVLRAVRPQGRMEAGDFIETLFSKRQGVAKSAYF